MQLKKMFVMLCVLALPLHALSQQSNYKELNLNDMSAFRSQAGNWRIVGSVVMDPEVDVHEPAAPAATTDKKGKRSRKEAAPAPKKEAVTFTEGKGILLNINTSSQKDNLVSILEHGDIELELDVMLPKGSNSGLYLQGRYELQLFDSWGVKNASFTDMGGIYRNWENQPGKIYMGKAPLSNASKAPGLWQNLKIAFKAPRFDNAGNKIENARFVSVKLNGVTIHENVEVPLPTGGAIENNEKATGPLLIQGDHGPVAIRNVRYRLMNELNYNISDVTWKIFHGNFKNTSDFANAKPALTGKSETFGVGVLDIENAYGITVNGNITVPQDALYNFQFLYTGGAKVIINNKELFNYPTPDGWRRDFASVQLAAGTYPFEIQNFKDASWMPPRFAWYVSTADSYMKSLHDLNSYPPDDNPVSTIYFNTGSAPKLLRAFLDYNGDRSKRLTHTIGVGDPSGVNYVYDLRSGNLVCVWRGDFIDATPMWHERGDGSFRPRGAALYLTNNQSLAYLNSKQDAFPGVAKEGDFKSKGYIIDESTGRPTFRIDYRGLEIHDSVTPENNTTLTHEVVIKKGNIEQGLYFKLAEGTSIVQLSNGSYAINDSQYYIKPAAGITAEIREVDGKKELICPMTQSIKYSIIW